MIRLFSLIRNVGTFDNAAAGRHSDLGRLTLIYAENGRGKTTLASILRSLATADPTPIAERSRLGSPHSPHVVVDLDGGTQTIFQNGAWTLPCSDIRIFDDRYVDENVCSGLTVSASHRQNLHEVVVGAPGVALAQRLQQLTDDISRLTTELRNYGNAIPTQARGGFSVDDFCVLREVPDLEAALNHAERMVASFRHAEAIHGFPNFDELRLPDLDLPGIESLLARGLAGLDAAAVERVRGHCRTIGENGEQWVGEGMRRVGQALPGVPLLCPFCTQDLATSSVFGQYRAYFGDAYGELRRQIEDLHSVLARQFNGDELARFQRTISELNRRRDFWRQFCELPDIGLDVEEIAGTWQATRDVCVGAVLAKRAAPLSTVTLDLNQRRTVGEFARIANVVEAANVSIRAAAATVAAVKRATAVGSQLDAEAELAKLHAVKNRFSAEVAPLCDQYVRTKSEKTASEIEKDKVRLELDGHRRVAFPAFEAAINRFLEAFGAGFRIGRVAPADFAGRPTSTYLLVINRCEVPLSAERAAGARPTFGNTLSSGDRNSLALAFFLASLESDRNIGNCALVIDDPVSSLDDHRKLTTVHEVRELARKAAQVIVLSHDKSFLCRIWERANRAESAALRVMPGTTGSELVPWDIAEESQSEHDRRFKIVANYRDTGVGEARTVAESLRLVLEGFLRVYNPMLFPPGGNLNQYMTVIRRTVPARFEPPDFRELEYLAEYAGRFHHETDPAYQAEQLNEQELRRFAERTIAFVQRR